jgi:hypothetical protein
MSLCAVGGDPVRDVKLGAGTDAAAGAAVGQDGAAARQLRSPSFASRPPHSAASGAAGSRQAARAAPKIQLGVALLLVPSFLLMIAAGLLANIDRFRAGF